MHHIRKPDRKEKRSDNAHKQILTTPVILGAKQAVKHSESHSRGNDSSQNVAHTKGPELLKMINEHFEFCLDTNPKLSDNEEFTVIGVIGGQGVGKSTLLNELSGWEGPHPIFATQTGYMQLQCEHQTVGVDLYITPERLILLDTQPFFSSSALLNMQKVEFPLGDIVSHEHLLRVQALQIDLLLLSICHLVLVVQESEPDLLLWRTLRTASMLKQNIADVSSTATDAPEQVGEYSPDIAVVFNKLSGSDHLDLIRTGEQLQGVIHKFFSFCKTKNADIEEGKTQNQMGKIEGIGAPIGKDLIEHFLIPFAGTTGYDHNITPCYQVAKDDFVNRILAYQRRPFPRQISEKEWLKNSSKIWDSIKRSPLILDYNRTWQKMQVFKS